jgi:hypothetical protein
VVQYNIDETKTAETQQLSWTRKIFTTSHVRDPPHLLGPTAHSILARIPSHVAPEAAGACRSVRVRSSMPPLRVGRVTVVLDCDVGLADDLGI